MDVAFGLAHNVIAFIAFRGPGGPEAEFEETSYWVNVMKMVFYVGQTIIGDLILLFRTWVVYGHNYWVVALPVTIWVAGSVCGVMAIFEEATQTHESGLNSSDVSPYITSMLTLTLLVNVFSSSLIVYRIHSVRSNLRRRSVVPINSPLSHTLRVFIESGLMYTTSMIILLVVFVSSNNALYGVSDSAVQIIGITSNLIIIRVNSKQSNSRPTSPYPRSSNKAPQLHMINVQTTISQYPPASSVKMTQDQSDLEVGVLRDESERSGSTS